MNKQETYEQIERETGVKQNVLETIEETFGTNFELYNPVSFKYDRQITVFVSGKIEMQQLKRLEYHDIEVQTIEQKDKLIRIVVRVGDNAF